MGRRSLKERFRLQLIDWTIIAHEEDVIGRLIKIGNVRLIAAVKMFAVLHVFPPGYIVAVGCGVVTPIGRLWYSRFI